MESTLAVTTRYIGHFRGGLGRQSEKLPEAEII